jgi:Flp pilus assembly protein TadB
MKMLRSAVRTLFVLAAIGVAIFLVSAWQSWQASSRAKEIFSAIRKGMTEKAVVDIAESKKGRIHRLSKDESGVDEMVIVTSGGSLLCRVMALTRAGMVVDSYQGGCIQCVQNPKPQFIYGC